MPPEEEESLCRSLVRASISTDVMLPDVHAQHFSGIPLYVARVRAYFVAETARKMYRGVPNCYVIQFEFKSRRPVPKSAYN
eukprot:281623-Pelagomonas_calceolata.AAC.1